MSGQPLAARHASVSLFSNCGAGDVGYRKSGFEFDVMAELDPRRLEVALANHPGAAGVSGDLRETWPQVVTAWRARHGRVRPTLLAACPPCQGMSSARSDRGRINDAEAGARDPRNLLVTVIAEVAKRLRPRVIVVENVPAFLTRLVPHPADGKAVAASRLLIDLLSEDYETFSLIGDLADWGVPQTRKRAFLTLIRKNERGLRLLHDENRAPFPRPTNAPDYGGERVSVRTALENLNAGRLDAARAATAASESDPLHQVPVWEDRRYAMVAAVPPHSGASAWQTTACSSCAAHTSGDDAAACHACGAPLLRPVVRANDGWRLVRGFHSSSYTRMASDRPAATITTASGHIGSDHTLHPWENRVLSMTECAHLQTLPRDFKWVDSLARWGHTNVREMIGEAVPPRFTELHGKAIIDAITGSSTVALITNNDVRVVRARTKLGMP